MNAMPLSPYRRHSYSLCVGNNLHSSLVVASLPDDTLLLFFDFITIANFVRRQMHVPSNLTQYINNQLKLVTITATSGQSNFT